MTGEREKPPRSVMCENCHKVLAHDRRFCPLFPDEQPPTTLDYEHYRATGESKRVPGKKWSECVCTIHTCSPRPYHVGARS